MLPGTSRGPALAVVEPVAVADLCPRRLHAVPVRTAPSETVRLVRHGWQGRSCTDTGTDWRMNP